VIDECAQFPKGKHDDIVDVFSMMHMYFSRMHTVRIDPKEAAPYSRYGGVVRV
jgi:phage terminase large subunit-like protein